MDSFVANLACSIACVVDCNVMATIVFFVFRMIFVLLRSFLVLQRLVIGFFCLPFVLYLITLSVLGFHRAFVIQARFCCRVAARFFGICFNPSPPLNQQTGFMIVFDKQAGFLWLILAYLPYKGLLIKPIELLGSTWLKWFFRLGVFSFGADLFDFTNQKQDNKQALGQLTEYKKNGFVCVECISDTLAATPLLVLAAHHFKVPLRLLSLQYSKPLRYASFFSPTVVSFQLDEVHMPHKRLPLFIHQVLYALDPEAKVGSV